MIDASRPGEKRCCGRIITSVGADEVVLFGGTTATGKSRETWLWNGTTWSLVDGGPLPIPSAESPKMAWDPARRKLVLLSGDFFEAWEWTGTSWSTLGPISNRESPSGAVVTSSYDGAGTMVMGGYYYSTFESSNTWELRWDSSHVSDACHVGDNLDGDALAGCNDRDCWSVCTPTCRPGDTCNTSAPRCGNGSCEPAESCRSCPADCTNCPNVCGDGVCDLGEACPGDCP